jgi:hypothetical protein
VGGRGTAKPGDYTGRQREAVAKQYAEVVAAREHELGMTISAHTEPSDTVTDMVKAEPVKQTNDEGEVTYVEPPARVIRIAADIENMTLGVGNNYTFKEGQLYRVPAGVADHLEELGYVWH